MSFLGSELPLIQAPMAAVTTGGAAIRSRRARLASPIASNLG